MESDYYHKKLYIPAVDTSGMVIGSVERWEAHEKGILHKGFSVAVYFQNKILMQVRKHPVFDSVIDVTASSHPLMTDTIVEDEKDAVVRCLEREWNSFVSKKDISTIGSQYYQAKDPLSEFIEHEYCTFYSVVVDTLPKPNFEFSYGYMLVQPEYIRTFAQSLHLAPWVSEGFLVR